MGQATKRKRARKGEKWTKERVEAMKRKGKGGWYDEKAKEDYARAEEERERAEAQRKRDIKISQEDDEDDSEWETDDEETIYEVEDNVQMHPPINYWIISIALLQNYMADCVVCKVPFQYTID